MKITIIVAIILLAMVLSGCRKEAQTSNVEFKVELLFEKDGCKIYRFYDGANAVYWTDCRGKTEYSYQQSTGKSSYEARIQNETTTH